MLGSDGSASESDDEEAATHEAPRPVWIVGSTAGQSSLDDAIVSNGDTGTGRFNATFQLVCCVLTWYVLSITLTLGNKMIFSGGKGITAALPCPLIITALHIGMKVPLARFGMRHAGLQQISFGSWSAWLARIAPVGLAAALDIGLSNASLVYITVTQYTVVKSSAPMWILMISVALGLQKPKPALVLVVLSIASGIALASQPPTLAEQVGTQMTGNLVEEVAGSSSLQSVHTDVLSERELNRTAAAAADDDDGFDANHATRKALFWLAMDGDDGAASLMPPAHFFRSARHARKKWQGSCREDPASCGWLGSWTWSAGGAAPASSKLPPAHAASPRKEGSTAEAEAPGAGQPIKWFGLLLVFSAAVCGAFRWAWMEFLLRPAAPEGTEMKDLRQGSKNGSNLSNGGAPALHPLALVSATASLGFSAMLPVALYLEIPSIMTRVASLPPPGMGYGRMLLLRAVVATLTGGLVAFAMLLVELRIVQLASSLTLSVAGVLKEVLTVAASAALLGDVLSRWNVLGLALCVAGIAGYHWIKHSASES